MFEARYRRDVVVIVVCTLALVAAAAPAAAQAGTIVCESTRGERAFCSADTSHGVTLQRQLGDAPCTGNWGSDENGIWVTNRCRGEFLLGQADGQTATDSSLVNTLFGMVVGGQSTPSPSGGSVVVCESKDNKRTTCPVDTRGGVELQRQLSSASCAGAWGHTPDGIWVDKGCRAEFKVYGAQARTPTPAPGQKLTCESKDNRRAFCSADTRGGVELRRQLGQASCIGHWGYDSDGVWVDNGCRAELTLLPAGAVAVPREGTIICSSKRNQRAFCSADTRSGVTLQRQLGDSTCTGNWGYDADGIWVDNGCQAEFRTQTTSNRPRSTTLPGPGSVVTCESDNNQPHHCPANTSNGVKLQRQLSTATCVGHWGYDAGGIWVEDGCRAEFLIR